MILPDFIIVGKPLKTKDKIGNDIVVCKLQKKEYITSSGELASNSIDPNKILLFIFPMDYKNLEEMFTEEETSLDISDFKIEVIRSQNSEYDVVYLHNEYYKICEKFRKSLLPKSEIKSDLQNCIDECLLVYPIEMFFYSLLRAVRLREFNYDDGFDFEDLSEVVNHYKKVCLYVLKETAYAISSDYDLKKEDEDYFSEIYNDTIEYGREYPHAVSTFVICNEHYETIICKELNDKPVSYSKFFQHCMLEGYNIAINNIERNLRNREFFDYNILETNESKVLKLYPTPLAFMMGEKLTDYAKSGHLNGILDDYFLDKGFERVIHTRLRQKLGTKYIFAKPEDSGIYYYKKRSKSDCYIPFGDQDRKYPLRALTVQGQMNLTFTHFYEYLTIL